MKDHGFIKCSCYGEGIHVWSDDGEVWLSLWTSHYYNGHRLGWWDRLRHAWHVLRTGEPFADQVCLDRDGAAELVAALTVDGGEG